MTHDELLARLDLSNEHLIPYEEFEKRNSALRAVVELHKPKAKTKEGEDICGCAYGVWTFYPCPTIQAIEKELQ